jgi:hypothetical protein
MNPKPLLRCYRHIVGEQVWRKLLEYVYCRHITQSAGELLKYLDYESGSALEGNILHWVENDRKSRQ